MKNDKEKIVDFIKFLEKLGVTLYPYQKEFIKLIIASKNHNAYICVPKNIGRKVYCVAETKEVHFNERKFTKWEDKA